MLGVSFGNSGRLPKLAMLLSGAGAYFLHREAWLVGGILLALGAVRWLSILRDPRRLLRQAVLIEAQRQMCSVPNDGSIWSALTELYARYYRARAGHPALASTYDEIISSMWSELRAASTYSEWRRLIGTVFETWPEAWQKGGRPIEKSLERAQNAARAYQSITPTSSQPSGS